MHRQVIEDAYYVGGARFPPSTVPYTGFSPQTRDSSRSLSSQRSCFGGNGNRQYLTSLKHDAVTSFARGMRCKCTAVARFPQHIGCRAFGTKYAPSRVSTQSTLQSTLSQHYSQHYSQHCENTANHSISWNLHIFRYKMKIFSFFLTKI